MNTLEDKNKLQPGIKYVFCLEGFELAFEEDVLAKIVNQWNEGASIEFIAKQEKRRNEEVFLAIFDQACKGNIKRPFGWR